MNLVREARFHKRMSQMLLFRKTGIWPSRISYIENGYMEPNDKEKQKLAKALEVEIEELFPSEQGHQRGSLNA
jgi:transcriptional regulator with XRE-family HTH domain